MLCCDRKIMKRVDSTVPVEGGGLSKSNVRDLKTTQAPFFDQVVLHKCPEEIVGGLQS